MSAKDDAKLRRVSSAATGMSILIDEIVRQARKSFRESGKTEVDAKFLKESVGALKELFELLEEYEPGGGKGITVTLENGLEEWGK